MNFLTFEWYKAVKGATNCVSCGDKPEDMRDLQFHHVDPKQKKMDLSNMVRAGFAKAAVLKEMKKCVPMCTDCHTEVHSGLRRGWLVTRDDRAEKAMKYMPFEPFVTKFIPKKEPRGTQQKTYRDHEIRSFQPSE